MRTNLSKVAREGSLLNPSTAKETSPENATRRVGNKQVQGRICTCDQSAHDGLARHDAGAQGDAVCFHKLGAD
jgi:hypothetical protein